MPLAWRLIRSRTQKKKTTRIVPMGFLKRLELQGFKSFAGKTVLDFSARTVAVVGPNGSGKSNIIDAFRWVLGEREAKQLRGETLENLIFAGTPKRATVGFARVGLYFDNQDGGFPFAAQEITLERKVDRSGTSQFSINGEEIRLRDLAPMLARAKLGNRGLTMIGQGQSDMFVQSSPDERRMMIEEILGLKEFRIKKSQAERRLFTSRINMDKVQAMLEELLPHLRVLRRQKHRWDKRGEIENELHRVEDEYYSTQYHALAEKRPIEASPLREMENSRKAKEKEIEALEKELKKLDAGAGGGERAKEIRGEIAKRFDVRAKAQVGLTRIEVTIEMQSRPSDEESVDAHRMMETLRTIRDDIANILEFEDLEKVREVLRGWKERISGFFAVKKTERNASLEDEKKKYEKELSELDREIHSLREEEEKVLHSQEENNRAFRRQVEFLEKKKNELRTLDRRVQAERFEHEKVAMRLEELLNEWKAFGRAVDELKHITPSGAYGEQELSEMQRRMVRLRGELAAIGEIDEALVKEAEESEERYAFLTKELDDLEHAIADLKELVKELEHKIHGEFSEAFKQINDEFNDYFRLMFGGGRAKMKLLKKKKPVPVEGENGETASETEIISAEEEKAGEEGAGIEIDLNLPKKRITSLEMLSGGEKSLVSIAALFALIAVSPPPFLVLDEVDAPLDESNARRFAELVKNFSSKTQFLIVTHNRATMEAADVLYGITMGDDGVSKVLSMKMEE